jgi:hypothetical protein
MISRPSVTVTISLTHYIGFLRTFYHYHTILFFGSANNLKHRWRIIGERTDGSQIVPKTAAEAL